jgi:hypothetical protein
VITFLIIMNMTVAITDATVVKSAARNVPIMRGSEAQRL